MSGWVDGQPRTRPAPLLPPELPVEVVNAPDCECGHKSPWHKGTDRTGSPLRATGCRMCVFCDYYKLPRE